MEQCDYCGTSILFGGVQQGEARFCNQKCSRNGFTVAAANQIPAEVVSECVMQVHQGNCPRCGGRGPVDVHKSFRVCSAVVVTFWNTEPTICCRSCGIKGQLLGAFSSFIAGWWGFPWGLFLTPVQITRNFISLCHPPGPAKPSPDLARLIRFNMAAQLVARNQEHPPSSAKPPPLPPPPRAV